MGHFLRTAVEVIGVAVSIAAAIPSGGTSLLAGALSVSATTGAEIAAGVSLAAAGIEAITAKKPAQLGNPSTWQSDPQAGIPHVGGRMYTGGQIVLRNTSGKDSIAQSIHTIYSTGPIKGFESLYVSSVATGVDADGNADIVDKGKLVVATQLGRQPEPSAFGFWDSTPGLTAASKLSGLAAGAVRLYYDTKGGHTLTTEPQIGYVVLGTPVYDPRKDSTYPGGNGPQRWNDETTWDFAGYDNPGLKGLSFLIGYRQSGKLVIGAGMPIASINVAQLVEMANVCDANGWKYACAISSTDDPWDVYTKILQAGGAIPTRTGTIVGAIVNTPKVSLATFERDDIIGPWSIQATQSRRDRINTIVPRYMAEQSLVDETTDKNGNTVLQTLVNWGMAQAGAIQVADYVTFDGEVRQKEVDYPFVTGVSTGDNAPNQIAQLARYDIENAREFGPISLPMKPRWMGYRAGDVIKGGASLTELGLVGQDIMLLQRQFSPGNMTVTFTARSETKAKHAFALGQTTTAPPTPSLSGPPLVPVPGNAAWALTAGTVTSTNGTAGAALFLNGTSDSSAIDAVIVEMRISTEEQDADADWEGVTTLAPSFDGQLTITGVKDLTPYQVAVSYRMSGNTGTRLVLGPAEAGQTSVGWAAGVTGAGKPEDNATVGAPAGTSVNGVPVEYITASIDSLTATAQDLVAAYGDTASAAAAADAAQAAQSAAEQADSDATARAVAADGSASSAAGQASIATTQAQAAGSSASAAQAYAVAANGYAANALSSASAAGSYAASAGSNAAAAQQSATLSATIGPGTLNPNPSFASWTDPTSAPDSWSAWNYNGGTPVRVSGLDAVPYSCHFDATANNDCGIQQTFNQAAGKYIVEVTADLTAGTWDGAGVILQWYNLSGGQLTSKGGQSLSFLTATDTAGYVGNNGARRSWSMYVDTGVDGSINYFALYAIANYSGFGAAESGKGVTFRSLRVRAASAAEIAGQQALPLANSAIAQISTESSVRASADAALSSRVDTVTSSVGSLSSSVTSLSATTNNLSSRVSTAIFQVAAQAGTSRALFKILADGFGQSSIDLVAASIHLWSQDGSNAIEALSIDPSGLVTIPYLAAQQISVQHLNYGATGTASIWDNEPAASWNNPSSWGSFAQLELTPSQGAPVLGQFSGRLVSVSAASVDVKVRVRRDDGTIVKGGNDGTGEIFRTNPGGVSLALNWIDTVNAGRDTTWYLEVIIADGTTNAVNIEGGCGWVQEFTRDAYQHATIKTAAGTGPGAGSGGGGSINGGGSGFACPEQSEPILLANDAHDGPGATIPAGQLRAGMWVWTQHEQTFEWGAYRVTFVGLVEDELWSAPGRSVTSPSHLWRLGEEWVRMDAIGTPVGRRGTVVSLHVDQAHTYVVGGDLSHNKTVTAIND